MNREEELDESIIQPTPGNSFTAVHSHSSSSESTVSPKSSSYSTHSSSSGVLSDFNFTLPSSVHVLSRNNTPTLSSSIEDSTDKKNQELFTDKKPYTSSKIATSTPYIDKRKSTRGVSEMHKFSSDNQVDEIANKVILSSSSSSDDELKHQKKRTAEFSGRTLDVPAWCNANANPVILSQSQKHEDSLEVNPSLSSRSLSEIKFDLKTDSQSMLFKVDSDSDLKKIPEKITEDELGSPSQSMNFELSQDFSQVASHKSLAETSDEARHEDSRQPPKKEGGDSNNNLCKRCDSLLAKNPKKIKELFFTTFRSSGEKLPHISCPQCSSTLEIASSDLSVHQHDLEAVHKEAENESSEHKMQLTIKQGMKVFAIYSDGCYYPAVVLEVKRQFNLVTVCFDDGTGELDVPIDEVITLQLFQKGQRVSVKLPDGYYYDGEIYASDVVDDQHFYCVNLNGKTRIVQRSLICLKKTYFDRSLMYNVEESENKKVLKKGFKRKRHAEIPLSSSSSFEDTEPAKRSRVSEAKGSEKTSLLFKDLLFLITAADAKQPLEENDERIDKDRISKLIISNSGEIISTIHSREFQKAKNVVCISDAPSSSHIFLYCVVVGIPILHYEWVDRSIERNACQSYHSYVVPAGVNIQNEVIEQNYGKREPYNCLNPLRIYVHQDTKTNSKDFNLILSKAGCERVAPGIFVTDQTRALSFSLLNVDYILTLNEKVPSVIWDASVVYEIPVVTFAWLNECLITNQLVDTAASPLFLYKPL